MADQDAADSEIAINDASSPRGFAHFENLPLELRDAIWESAVEPVALLHIHSGPPNCSSLSDPDLARRIERYRARRRRAATATELNGHTDDHDDHYGPVREFLSGGPLGDRRTATWLCGEENRVLSSTCREAHAAVKRKEELALFLGNCIDMYGTLTRWKHSAMAARVKYVAWVPTSFPSQLAPRVRDRFTSIKNVTMLSPSIMCHIEAQAFLHQHALVPKVMGRAAIKLLVDCMLERPGPDAEPCYYTASGSYDDSLFQDLAYFYRISREFKERWGEPVDVRFVSPAMSMMVDD